MFFLQNQHIHFNPIALFGFTLLLGLLGGELARLTKILPPIFGYICIGILVGPNVFNIASKSALLDARFFVEIALGLILFDLGRHLDFSWLRNDKGLLWMSLFETFFTFFSIFLLFYLFHFSWLASALTATIATATSPAVIMLVANDTDANGPITRRTIALTALNNFFALIIFTILLPISYLNSSPNVITGYVAYRLIGSFILSSFIFLIMLSLAHITNKAKQSQFVLFVGAITLAIGATISLHLSTMLSLFILGVAARNFDYKHRLIEIDFGWLGKLFFILLFVTTGVYLKFNGFWQYSLIIVIFLLTKFLAKTIAIFCFKKQSRLTTKQAIYLSLALSPMADLAIGMSNRLIYFNPNFDAQLILILSTGIAILYVVCPIILQSVFLQSGEARIAPV